MQTEEALIQDAVAVFSKAFGDNATFVQMFQMNPASCNNPRRDDQDTTSSGKDVIAKINEVRDKKNNFKIEQKMS